MLAKAIKQENEVKKKNPHQKEVKLSLFSNNLILYIENPKKSTKNLLELLRVQQVCRVQDQRTKIKYISIS
jgi:hypothetical protein